MNTFIYRRLFRARGRSPCQVWRWHDRNRGFSFRTDLDQLLPEPGQRPVLDRLGRRQRAQEAAEVVGRRMELQPDRISCGRPQPKRGGTRAVVWHPCRRRRADRQARDAQTMQSPMSGPDA